MSQILNTNNSNGALNPEQFTLIGSPNSGKTTLYNWLTGSKTKTVNYPGATIELSLGALNPQIEKSFSFVKNKNFKFIDTPGIYSLTPQSEDEQITLKILNQVDLKYDHVVLVIDATQLNRQLLLAQHLLTHLPCATIVLTMVDLIEKNGQIVDLAALKSFLKTEQIYVFDGLLGQGLKELLQHFSELNHAGRGAIKKDLFKNFSAQPDEKIKDLQMVSEFLKNKSVVASKNLELSKNKKNESNISQLELTLKIDQFLLHPFWGYFFFISLMTLFFASIYWLAAPLMDIVDGGISQLMDLTKAQIPNLWGEFIADGLLAAVSGVIIFVPQIFILFLGIGLFENTGYLSRIAALIDGPLQKIGLGGRAFVPMLSGFACAVPALMATRNITSKKERLIAQLVIPLMSCSARLPVYGLMIGFLFGDSSPLKAGFVMASLYFLSLVFGAIASGVLSKILKTQTEFKKDKSRLMMDLPYYRRPRFRVLFRQATDKSISFIKRAGPVIAVLSIVLWVATQFPKPTTNAQGEVVEVPSYAMQLSQAIEPIFKPMGVDGRVGFALLASFAAREVFVSSLAISLKADLGDNEDNQAPLIEQMKTAQFSNGQPIFTLGSVVGILLFFIVATQCLSTVGVLRKESGGWKWTLAQLIGSNVIAYALAVLAVQLI